MSTNLSGYGGPGYGAKKQVSEASSHIAAYRKNEAKNGYAHLLTEVMLGDSDVRGVLEYLHKTRKEMEQISYEGRNSFTVVPEDVAADTGLSERSANNILSMLSSRDFPVLRRGGFKTYRLTEMGDACMSDISYRNNLEKLKDINGGKVDAAADV